jgi:hypothetical protein
MFLSQRKYIIELSLNRHKEVPYHLFRYPKNKQINYVSFKLWIELIYHESLWSGNDGFGILIVPLGF